MSEVRGSGQECQTATAQERPRGATRRPRLGMGVGGWGGGEDSQRLRSGAAGGRSYPTPPRLRPGAVAGRTNPTSKEPWLRGQRRA